MENDDGGRAPSTVVFVHGSPGSAEIFARVRALLPPRFSVICLDLPDHGSANDESSLSLDAFDAAVEGWIGSARGAVTVVGYSFGAFLAARALSVCAKRVERAVLLGGFARLTVEAGVRNTNFADMVAAGTISPAQTAEAARGLWFGTTMPSAEVDKLALDPLRRERPARLSRQLARVGLLTSERIVPSIFDVPTVLLHGANDEAVAPELGRALHERARNGNFRLIAGAAHALPVLSPELVVECVAGES